MRRANDFGRFASPLSLISGTDHLTGLPYHRLSPCSQQKQAQKQKHDCFLIHTSRFYRCNSCNWGGWLGNVYLARGWFCCATKRNGDGCAQTRYSGTDGKRQRQFSCSCHLLMKKSIRQDATFSPTGSRHFSADGCIRHSDLLFMLGRLSPSTMSTFIYSPCMLFL